MGPLLATFTGTPPHEPVRQWVERGWMTNVEGELNHVRTDAVPYAGRVASMPSRICCSPPVGMASGAMALTRTPLGASSRARVRVRWATAAFMAA